MRLLCYYGALPFLVAGCSSGQPAARSMVADCWEGVRGQGNHLQIEGAKFIYLRGATIVAPSPKCKGVRLQGVDFSKKSREILEKIEYRDLTDPLGVRGTLEFTLAPRRSAGVIEASIIDIDDYSKLDVRESRAIMKRVLDK